MTKKIKISNFEVAFTTDGTLCEQFFQFMKAGWRAKDYKLEQNNLFTDTIEYNGYRAGKGNSHILFKSLTTGRQYHMLMSLFDKVIEAKQFVDNKITGQFYFCKKGVAQSICLLLEDPI